MISQTRGQKAGRSSKLEFALLILPCLALLVAGQLLSVRRPRDFALSDACRVKVGMDANEAWELLGRPTVEEGNNDGDYAYVRYASGQTEIRLVYESGRPIVDIEVHFQGKSVNDACAAVGRAGSSASNTAGR